MKKQSVLVVSAINFFEGGPLSVLKDCLSFLNTSAEFTNHKIIALVHREELFNKADFEHIEFIAFPKSRSSYLYRLYYEYFYFNKFAAHRGVDFWLSLHDITPRLKNVQQAVYCHNPSPFNEINFKDIFVQPTQFLFRLFYKYLYRINIYNNKYVIVQQQWIRERFKAMFNLPESKVIVALPNVPKIPLAYLQSEKNGAEKKLFFFPAYPRPFKNIEVICEAIKLLNTEGISNFKVLITIDGTENKYAKIITSKYGEVANLEFLGLLKREGVYRIYAEADCLIFPSKLETWGLPISEFKQYDKPILASNLPFAKETVGNYDKVKFFDPSNAMQLAGLMKEQIAVKAIKYEPTEVLSYPLPFANNWGELFSILLK